MVPAPLLQIPTPEKHSATACCQERVGLASTGGTVSEMPVLGSESPLVIGPTYSAVTPNSVVVAVVEVIDALADSGCVPGTVGTLRTDALDDPHAPATTKRAKGTSSRAVLIRPI